MKEGRNIWAIIFAPTLLNEKLPMYARQKGLMVNMEGNVIHITSIVPDVCRCRM